VHPLHSWWGPAHAQPCLVVPLVYPLQKSDDDWVWHVYVCWVARGQQYVTERISEAITYCFLYFLFLCDGEQGYNLVLYHITVLPGTAERCCAHYRT